MAAHQNIPIDTVHLFPVLDRKLFELLHSLTPEEWQMQTIAKQWVVKDVVAHLLDGNIRILSILRDQHYGEQPDSQSYQGMVDFLNRLNADWVKAMKRVSPAMLMLLHETTGKLYCDYYASLDPFGKAGFPVDWAGETESKNWMQIARDYTEKWLHQQQIRDAVNKPGLLTREFYYPFISVFMMALPHTYRNITAANDTIIKLTITSDIGGSWFLARVDDAWKLRSEITGNITSEVSIEPDIAWRLFSKSLRPDEIKSGIQITGDQTLGATALTMVSVMA